MVMDHSDSERKPAAATWATLRLAGRVLLYAPSHRQDSTYHGICYTSRGALAGLSIGRSSAQSAVGNHINPT